MQNNHNVIIAIAQNMPPWLSYAMGHIFQDATLSNIALLTSIAYSVVNIWVHLRKRARDED